jgi:PTS system fructose-specific IIC component
MMAIDMGGPLNKAAYVFGTGALATSLTDGTSTGLIIMAAVMVGGMTPPIGIAIAANLFPQKFTKQERKDAMVNYVMGLSFITEGAIPYAAKDPTRVIPSTAAGSLIAGLLSGLFGCTLMAPHGGLFVIPTIGNWYLYLIAIIVGSFVTAIMLGLLKKDEPNAELGKWKGIHFFNKK